MVSKLAMSNKNDPFPDPLIEHLRSIKEILSKVDREADHRLGVSLLLAEVTVEVMLEREQDLSQGEQARRVPNLPMFRSDVPCLKVDIEPRTALSCLIVLLRNTCPRSGASRPSPRTNEEDMKLEVRIEIDEPEYAQNVSAEKTVEAIKDIEGVDLYHSGTEAILRFPLAAA